MLVLVQVKKIRLLLRERNLGAVRVGTVDDFQGQEARIIFISTVLSRPADTPLAAGHSKPWAPPSLGDVAADPAVGFFRNPNRFNVAITRAQALMVVLGHPLVLMQVTPRVIVPLRKGEGGWCLFICTQVAMQDMMCELQQGFKTVERGGL